MIGTAQHRQETKKETWPRVWLSTNYVKNYNCCQIRGLKHEKQIFYMKNKTFSFRQETLGPQCFKLCCNFVNGFLISQL